MSNIQDVAPFSQTIIAIVDDDEAVRLATGSLVRSLGYTVRAYASAAEFLQAREGVEVACVITDVQMPEMSGIDLQQRLIATGSAVPIIFVTAFPTKSLRQRALAAGASDFLHKPCDGQSIVRSLRHALGVGSRNGV